MSSPGVDPHDAGAGGAGVIHAADPRPRRQCSVDGCDREAAARGWCKNHYNAWIGRGKTGDQGTFRWDPPSFNPWTGRVACPQCGSSKWTMPYHPGDPRWLCIECPGVFEPEMAGA